MEHFELTQAKRIHLIFIAGFYITMSLLFGITFAFIGSPVLAYAALSFCFILFLPFIFSLRRQKLHIFAYLLILVVTGIPVFMHLYIGSYSESFGVLFWVLLPPLLARYFLPPKYTRPAFAVTIVMLIGFIIAEQFIPWSHPLPGGWKEFFYYLNVISITVFIFMLTHLQDTPLEEV